MADNTMHYHLDVSFPINIKSSIVLDASSNQPAMKNALLRTHAINATPNKYRCARIYICGVSLTNTAWSRLADNDITLYLLG